MRFARKQYRNRPTKWQFLNRFYNIQREVWPPLKEEIASLEEKDLFKAWSLEADGLEAMEEWKWIVKKIAQANTKPDPVAHLNQINIYRLEQCVVAIEKRAVDLKAALADCKSEV